MTVFCCSCVVINHLIDSKHKIAGLPVVPKVRVKRHPCCTAWPRCLLTSPCPMWVLLHCAPHTLSIVSAAELLCNHTSKSWGSLFQSHVCCALISPRRTGIRYPSLHSVPLISTAMASSSHTPPGRCYNIFFSFAVAMQRGEERIVVDTERHHRNMISTKPCHPCRSWLRPCNANCCKDKHSMAAADAKLGNNLKHKHTSYRT